MAASNIIVECMYMYSFYLFILTWRSVDVIKSDRSKISPIPDLKVTAAFPIAQLIDAERKSQIDEYIVSI